MTSLTSAIRFTLRWRTLLRTLLTCALLITLTGPARTGEAATTATTWYVSITGDDDNTCQSAASACRNIGHAIDLAAPGDTIIIGAGTFSENLDVFKSLTLQGAGANVTIVDGAALGSTLLVTGGADTTVNLSYLTISNGIGTYGGGLYVGAGVVNVSHVEILNNMATQGGAGVFNQGRLSLTNVGIKNNLNSGQDRGGGLLNLGEANLVNVTVSDNTTGFGGGGIGNRGLMTITASLIDHNLNASLGGGIANSLSGRLTLINTTISNHPTGGGLHNINNGVVVMSGGVITNNESSTGGGGIYNLAQLTLNGTGLYNNQATTSFGGGLFNEGTAILNTITLQGNSASSGNGGGLYTGGISGSLTLNNSLVRANQTTNGNGGGLYGSEGSLTIAGVQFVNNTSDSLGGGLYNATAALITNADFIGNSATNGGGGLFNTGTNGNLVYGSGTVNGNNSATGNGGGLNNTARVDLKNLSIRDNLASGGGGLYNGTTGQLTVTNSSLYGNFAQQSTGGGIDNRGLLLLTASSLYSNTSDTQGGSGLYNAAGAQILNSTLSYNRVLNVANGGALLNNGGTLEIINVTISTNYGPNIVRASGVITTANSVIGAPLDSGNNCVGTLISLGHNLGSDASCGLTATGDISNTDPLLGVLQNNGGSTPTRSLLSNSPAVDAGNNVKCPATDQRGVSRPQGSTCDIGAYEVIGFTNSDPHPIAAGTCITSPINVPNSLVIGSLQIGTNITFQPRGNLEIKLYSPGQRVARLLDSDTGNSSNNLDVLWDDTAPNPVGIEDHNPAFPYYDLTRHPDHPLSVMSGVNSLGLWKLEICNVAATGSGTLNRWSLIMPSFGNPKVFLPIIRR